MANLTSSLTIKVLADTKQAKTAAQALRDVEKNARAAAKAMEGSGATDRFTKSLAGLKLQAKDIDTVRKAWTDYAKSASLAADASKWTKAQASDVKAWEQRTISALRSVKREQTAFNKATAAAAAKAADARMTPGRLIGGVAGLAAGHRVKEMGKKAVVSAAEFDIGTRKQRAFTDISEADQAGLQAQAKRIGQDTQFTNLDVVKAQTKAMQGLPTNFDAKTRAAVAEGILENVKNYALVMEADLETSSEGLRSYLQAFNKDISTKERALTESQKAVNQMVKMAKAGGMSDEDVQQFVKFAASSGSTAGLTPEAMMAAAAVARRGGLRGDEFGVAMRSAASKLVSPTKQGISALGAAGINYSDYVRMPKALDVGSFENHFKRETGKGFTDDVRKKLAGILSDPNALGSQASFIEAVTGATEGLFGKNKKGKTSAKDMKTIAKAARGFQKVSAAGVDAQKLMDDIMASDMTLAQLNAFFSDKHGGKFAITQRQRDEYNATRKQLRAAGDDPDFAKKKADEIMGGLGGAFERLKGSVENLTLAMGQANEAWLKPAMEKAGNALDAISESSNGVRQMLTAAGLLGGGVSAGAALHGFMGGGGLAGAAKGAMMPLSWLARAGAGPYGVAAGTAWMTYRGLGGGMAPNEAALMQELATLNKQIATLDSLIAGKESRGEDASGTIAKRNAAQARFDQLRGGVDTSNLEKAKTAAEGAKHAIDGMNVTATPKVETSSIQSAVDLAKQLNAELAKAGSLAASAKSSAAGAVAALGKVQRRRFSFGGVQGE